MAFECLALEYVFKKKYFSLAWRWLGVCCCINVCPVLKTDFFLSLVDIYLLIHRYTEILAGYLSMDCRKSNRTVPAPPKKKIKKSHFKEYCQVCEIESTKYHRSFCLRFFNRQDKSCLRSHLPFHRQGKKVAQLNLWRGVAFDGMTN